MMTVAVIDRLAHHSTLIEVQYDSYLSKVAMQHMAAEQTAMMPDIAAPQDKSFRLDKIAGVSVRSQSA